MKHLTFEQRYTISVMVGKAYKLKVIAEAKGRTKALSPGSFSVIVMDAVVSIGLALLNASLTRGISLSLKDYVSPRM